MKPLLFIIALHAFWVAFLVVFVLCCAIRYQRNPSREEERWSGKLTNVKK